MQTCTRNFTWDAAHRVVGHTGKCRFLHGHRYVAEVTCQANNLNNLGMVIDFSIVKDKVGSWIDEHWDHNAIFAWDDMLFKLDTVCDDATNAEEVCGRHPYCLDANPTAENLAKHLYYKANDLLKENMVRCVKVRVWETANCYSDYE